MFFLSKFFFSKKKNGLKIIEKLLKSEIFQIHLNMARSACVCVCVSFSLKNLFLMRINKISFLFLVLLSFSTSIMLSLGFILTAKAMQDSLLANVLRWPMELFDTTPLGRIMNRFFFIK